MTRTRMLPACAAALAAASFTHASTGYVDLTAMVRDSGMTPTVATSVQYGNYKAANAFDGIVPVSTDAATRYCSWGTSSATTGWVTYAFPAEFLANRNVILTEVTVSMSCYEPASDPRRAPSAWVFYGRDTDADEWTALYTQSVAVTDWDAAAMTSYTFRVPGNVSYAQYKFEATANNGMTSGNLRLHVGELAFLGYAADAAETSPAAPSCSVFTRGGTEASSRLVHWTISDYGYLASSADVFIDYAEGDSLVGASTIAVASGVSSALAATGDCLITGLTAGASYTARLRVVNSAGLSTINEFAFTVPLSADVYAGGDLQAALAAAKASISGGAASAVIRIGPGDYSISSELAIDAAVTILGIDGPGETAIRQTSTDSRVASLTATGACIDGVTLVGNHFNTTATYNGGVAYLNAVGAVLTNCVVTGVSVGNNGRCVVNGAGVYIDTAGIVADCTVTGNSSTRPGFGIYMKGSTSKTDANYWRNSAISHCRVVGNTGVGTSAQGCVYYHYGVVEYTLIAGNTAARYPSVGLCPTHNTSSAYSWIDHCTIAGNSSPHPGAGLATSSNASVALHNCIIWGNTPTDLIDDNVTFSHCCAPILSSANGNISSDPGFVDPANGDYRLRADSPCANAGEDQSDIGCFAPLQNATIESLNLSRSWAVPGQEIVFEAPAFQDAALSDTDSLEWSFGDGASATGATASHAFEATGDYEVAFVANISGESHTSRRTVHVVTTNETVSAGEDLVAAVQRVCRAAEASGSRGIVRLGAGLFDISDQLRIDAPVTVIGEGPESTCVTQRFDMARTAVLYDPEGMYAGICFAGGRSLGGGTGIPSEPRHGLGVLMTGGTVSNCVFESVSGGGQNSKVFGGGVNISDGLVVDSIFRNYSVNAEGGGVYATGGTIDRCVFTNLFENGTQHTTGNGTAVAIYGAATLRNSLVALNYGAYYPAGVYISGNRNAIVENCTIAGNVSSTTAGAGLNTASGTRNTLRNLVIHDNRTAGAVNDVAVGSATFDHCDVSSVNVAGTGNIAVDPGFVSYGVEGVPDDFRLAQGSLCIDSGSDGTDAGGLDLDLVERPQDGDGDGVSSIDMGCYEYVLGGDGLSCLFTLDGDGVGYAGDGLDVAFSSTVLWNGSIVSGDGIGYEWNFGDGHTLAGSGASFASPLHSYGDCAKHTVTLTVHYLGETASFERAECVILYPDTVYVAPPGESSDTFPYSTPETACSELLTAFTCVRLAIGAGAPSAEVRILPGTHALPAELAIDGVVRFVGLGSAPEDTRIVPAALSRCFVMTAAGSRVENLCVTGMALDTSGDGGAFYVSADAVVSNVVVASCAGSGHGANRRGLAFRASDGLIVDCVVRDCHGNGTYRSGEVVYLDGYAMMDRCVITNNYGGGQSSADSWTNFGQPGIGASVNGRATLRNSLVADNRSGYKAGAGVYLTGYANLLNCTVVNNRMVDFSEVGNYEKDGVGVYVISRNATVENCVVAGNTLADGTEANLGNVLDGVAYTISPDDGLDAEAGNLSAQPVFRDAASGDWRLAPSSPGVDQGRYSEWMADALDLARGQRKNGRAVDMGCYEAPATGSLILLR